MCDVAEQLRSPRYRARTARLWLPTRSTDDTQTSTGAPASAVGAAMDHSRWLAGTISVRHHPRGHFDCTTHKYAGSPLPGVNVTLVLLPSCCNAAVGSRGGLLSSHGIAGMS